MTLQERIDSFDAKSCPTPELIAMKNLDDFESKTIVVGDGIFNALLSKVNSELKQRGII
jgi:hypothetical protein